MPPQARLRQRHGSDALRLDRFDRDLPSYADGDDSAIYSGPSTPPLHKADGGPRLDSHHSRNRSSAYRSPRLAAQSFDTRPAHSRTASGSSLPASAKRPDFKQDFKLPPGASTPSLESSGANAQDVATYPPPPATWSNMPAKGQMAILALSRFVDFFQMASIQTYMVHQLKSFDPSLPDSVISHQAGVLQGSFTAAQIITSILWGRAADQPGVGRKVVLNIGLVGTGITMLGVGFSTTYTQAVVWRVLGGAVNGTVGSARTMVAEAVPKRWHPRAFLLLPAAFNFANVAGPILGGLLVNPVSSYPALFGPGSTFGGPDGVQWMQHYPYALANLLSTVLLWTEAILVTLYLKETLKGFRQVEVSNFDPVRLIRKGLATLGSWRARGSRMMSETATLKRGLLSGQEDDPIELDGLHSSEKGHQRPPQQLPFSRIWTSNVLWTLLSIAIFDFHMGAFANLWILFLSTDREYVPENQDSLSDFPAAVPAEPDTGLTPRDILDLTRRSASGPRHFARSAFKFSGGLAFPPPTIGFAMATIGFIGVILQFALYPWANGRYGLMRCFRGALFLFPLAYFLAPYISLLPSSSPPSQPASGFWVWAGIAGVVFLQVAARTFALPASIILLNNSSPHPSVLATIHGLGQADSATFRTFGPILSGKWFGTWLERGVVGMAWWFVAAISALGCVASFYVRNGSGHEILLPGEEMREDGSVGPASSSSGLGGQSHQPEVQTQTQMLMRQDWGNGRGGHGRVVSMGKVERGMGGPSGGQGLQR